MAKNIHITRRIWNYRLVNLALLVISLFAIFPIATTILISFKKQQDITRKPPIIFPCDTPTSKFDIKACRWAVEGYERVFAPKPSETALLGFELTGNLIQTYIPNTIMYAFSTALGVMFLASFSGFAFSRYQFKGHNALMTAIYAVTGVPIVNKFTGNLSNVHYFKKKMSHFSMTAFFLFLSTWDSFCQLAYGLPKAFLMPSPVNWKNPL